MSSYFKNIEVFFSKEKGSSKNPIDPFSGLR